MKNPTDQHDEMLIDYLEDDLEAPLKEDLKVLLQNSPQDQKKLKGLEHTKTIVKALAGVKVPSDDVFFAQLESKIMSQLDNPMSEDSDLELPSNVVPLRPRRWLQVAASAAVIVVVGFGVWRALTPGGVTLQGEAVASRDLLISTSAQNLDSFSDSLVNARGDSDLIMDIAAQRIDSLSQEETASVFDRLMK